MYTHHKPTDAEIMHQAWELLQKRNRNIRSADHLLRLVELPEQGRHPEVELRAKRSLQTCHRYSLYERPRTESPCETGAYVPELSARLENDRNITDGARRCARKIAELTYRRNRAGRNLEITVTYLMEALGRCRRTIQRYISNLEREGYIHVDVMYGERTRMCIGLIVRLQKLLLARHHEKTWPQTLKKPGATLKSQKYSLKLNNGDKCRIMPRNGWALKCMDGVFKSFMKTIPLFECQMTVPGEPIYNE